MKNKLFIGSLSYDSTEDSLREYFATVGEVTEAVIISDRDTGRSKGFGFVTMSSDEEAQKAIEQLDGTSLDGREIAVSIARPKEERPAHGNDGGRRSF